ncbi:MAG TPA: DoxX family membrane protein [Candidatus Baltobacteraceae bacterium]|jgi:uncharacterized membrane protein YphA (DoxX/SURF4 family)|nr:DoxX family membrane protein [Candidatus Baltobacteraceae bacterium]
MKNALHAIARTALGLMFVVFGLNDFVPFIPSPPSIPGYAGAFFETMVQSHFAWFVFGAQLIAGLLLVVNRFVPLALVILAAIIANIIAIHVTMWPAALVPLPLVVTVLWFIVASRYRDKLDPLLQPA